jgi:hypothetical protein
VRQRLAVLAAAVAGVTFVTAPRAHAAVESELVRRGVAAYEGVDYAQAVTLLEEALRETLTREEQLLAMRTLALSHFALGRRDDARRDFVRLLQVAPTFQLDRTNAPRLRSRLEEARAKVAMDRKRPAGVGELPEVVPELQPARPLPAQRLTVRAPPDRRLDAATRLKLFHRVAGTLAYSQLEAPRRAEGRFEVTLPSTDVAAPALEYYLVFTDAAGTPVGRAGSFAQPLAVEIHPPKVPPYKRGWFWGTLGGVAAAGAAAVVLGVLLAPPHLRP